jgi:hypothetical protein
MNKFSASNNWLDERDTRGAELVRRLNLAGCARNQAEERRIKSALKKLGISI